MPPGSAMGQICNTGDKGADSKKGGRVQAHTRGFITGQGGTDGKTSVQFTTLEGKVHCSVPFSQLSANGQHSVRSMVYK
jgi:hypothetical protein